MIGGREWGMNWETALLDCGRIALAQQRRWIRRGALLRCAGGHVDLAMLTAVL
jgi:hypothetical protein